MKQHFYYRQPNTCDNTTNMPQTSDVQSTTAPLHPTINFQVLQQTSCSQPVTPLDYHCYLQNNIDPIKNSVTRQSSIERYL